MKPLVIYHANCTDGFGAAFAAWLKFGDEAEYVPMNYLSNSLSPIEAWEQLSQAIPSKMNTDRDVYILDFSLPKPVMDKLLEVSRKIVWLDHHKSAFEMWCGKSPDIFFTIHKEQDESKTIILDDCRSGAMLAWRFFHPDTEVPMLIQHIDDRDRWQFKLEGSKELHAALASYQPWTFEMWRGIFLCGLFEKETWRVPEEFYMEGAAILRTHNQHIQAVLKQARPSGIKVLLSEDGFAPVLNGLAANAPAFLASDLGHELANKSGTFGLVWSMAGDGQIHCSLRSNGEYDVSAIAKAFGGGGHRNAAGFSTGIDTLLEWLK